MGVDTYLTVVFWLGILGVFIRSIHLLQDHPRQRTESLGGDVLGMFLAIAFLAWVTILKFWP